MPEFWGRSGHWDKFGVAHVLASTLSAELTDGALKPMSARASAVFHNGLRTGAEGLNSRCYAKDCASHRNAAGSLLTTINRRTRSFDGRPDAHVF